MGQTSSAEQPPSPEWQPGEAMARERIRRATEPEPPRVRVSFGTGLANAVYGWPSTGGYLTLTCDGVELDFLGIDRFEMAPASQDPAEEDAHCARMRRLGARWWASKQERELRSFEYSEEDESGGRIKIFGWPSSGDGVWVLNLSMDQAWERRAGRIYNTTTMDERCRWIEKLGGTCYPEPEDCPLLDLQGRDQGNPATDGLMS